MKTITILLVMLALVFKDVQAQQIAPPRVQHYPTTGYTILDFAQDNSGALWCGTSDGLKSYETRRYQAIVRLTWA